MNASNVQDTILEIEDQMNDESIDEIIVTPLKNISNICGKLFSSAELDEFKTAIGIPEIKDSLAGLHHKLDQLFDINTAILDKQNQKNAKKLDPLFRMPNFPIKTTADVRVFNIKLLDEVYLNQMVSLYVQIGISI
jgi:hypothetical protein